MDPLASFSSPTPSWCCVGFDNQAKMRAADGALARYASMMRPIARLQQELSNAAVRDK